MAHDDDRTRRCAEGRFLHRCVVVRTDPGATNPTWNASGIDGAIGLIAVSCPGESLCVAADESGDVLTSENPAAGDASWHSHEIDPSGHLQTISCSPTGTCVALDSAGAVFASANVSSQTPTWSETEIDSTAVPESVSCTLTGLCVVVDSQGQTLTSDEPTAAIPAWSSQNSDSHRLTGISCLPEGLCTAIDARGEALQGFVPAPIVSVGSATEVSAGEETVTGTIDPNDAQLSSCRFEYGLTSSYGQSVPCANQPLPTGTTQAVSAHIQGLASASTYRFRVLAEDAAGTGVSSDGTFTTAAAIGILQPTPTIVGVPAVGERLRCLSGISSPAVTLTYVWYHDATPIAATNSSIYQVRSGDAKHHLQCKVTATDAAGSASATSAFVAIPAQGIVASVGETTVGKARSAGKLLLVPVQCSPRAAGGCTIELKLSLTETLKGKRVVAVAASAHDATGIRRNVRVTLASARVRMSPGQLLTISIPLKSSARSLLSRMHKLPAELTVVGTVIGALKASLSHQQLTLGGAAAGAARRR
jgi:hypothetical protein